MSMWEKPCPECAMGVCELDDAHPAMCFCPECGWEEWREAPLSGTAPPAPGVSPDEVCGWCGLWFRRCAPAGALVTEICFSADYDGEHPSADDSEAAP